MQHKWKIGIAIWFGFLLYFGIGSHYKKNADLFLVVLYLVLLLAASFYVVVIWLRDRMKGEPQKTYHMRAYPAVFYVLCWTTRTTEKSGEKFMMSKVGMAESSTRTLNETNCEGAVRLRRTMSRVSGLAIRRGKTDSQLNSSKAWLGVPWKSRISLRANSITWSANARQAIQIQTQQR
jgi:hypothetical protein